MHNEMSDQAPEIYGIYFYTGAGWEFTQNNQECSLSVGDALSLGFATCHFVKPPVPRLVKGTWAQVKLAERKSWVAHSEARN